MISNIGLLKVPSKTGPNFSNYIGKQTQHGQINHKIKPQLFKLFEKTNPNLLDYIRNHAKIAQSTFETNSIFPIYCKNQVQIAPEHWCGKQAKGKVGRRHGDSRFKPNCVSGWKWWVNNGSINNDRVSSRKWWFNHVHFLFILRGLPRCSVFPYEIVPSGSFRVLFFPIAITNPVR